MNKDISELRQNYTRDSLDIKDLKENPIEMFQLWFQDAENAGILEPNSMTLATADKKGIPSARIVLLKGLLPEGFVFYTNYESKKGQDLLVNPFASLVFLWKEIERQVRVEGKVVRLTEEASYEYYKTRPRDSQLGAWTSPQSSEISDREVLEVRLAQMKEKFKGEETLPLPPFWGGYLVIPECVEFWQGRTSRLHDRLKYIRSYDGWDKVRLAP